MGSGRCHLPRRGVGSHAAYLAADLPDALPARRDARSEGGVAVAPAVARRHAYSHLVRRGERKLCAHEAESTHVARFEPVRGGPSESRPNFGGEGRGFFRDSRGEAFLPTATTLSKKTLFMMATAGGSQRPVRRAKEEAVGGNARLAQQTKETHERVEPQS